MSTDRHACGVDIPRAQVLEEMVVLIADHTELLADRFSSRIVAPNVGGRSKHTELVTPLTDGSGSWCVAGQGREPGVKIGVRDQEGVHIKRLERSPERIGEGGYPGDVDFRGRHELADHEALDFSSRVAKIPYLCSGDVMDVGSRLRNLVKESLPGEDRERFADRGARSGVLFSEEGGEDVRLRRTRLAGISRRTIRSKMASTHCERVDVGVTAKCEDFRTEGVAAEMVAVMVASWGTCILVR